MSILLYNANVFGTDAEYVLVRGNRIEKTGSGTLPDAARRINLNGARIYPGFCDAHTHMENIALMHGTLDLTGKSRDTVLQMVQDACAGSKMVIGRGWDESFWDDKRLISGEELDNLCSEKVVMLIREDGHLAVVNRVTAEKCGVVTDDGIIYEKEIERCVDVLNLFSTVDLEYAQSYALSRGVTCVHDFATLSTVRRYFAMHRAGKLRMRVYASFYEDSYDLMRKVGLYSGFGDAFLRVGALKLFADGSIGAETAAMKYASGDVKKPMLGYEELRSKVVDANKNGFRVFTHAIGTDAIDAVVRAYAGTTGNRIEHFEMPVDEHIRDDVEVCVQPNFLKWAKTNGLYHKKLGAQWLYKNNPYRRMLDAGMKMLFGSDCMPMDPLYGIKLVTESEFAQQRLTHEEAVRLYTAGSKYMAPNLGEILVGSIADLVAVNEENVILTMVNGKIEYEWEKFKL